MIFGHLKDVATEYCWLPRALKKALQHLHDTDCTKLPPGNYELEGKDMYVQVFDTTTKPFSASRAEFHKQYVDVHFLVRGNEAMGFATDTGNNRMDEDTMGSRDIAFYTGMEHESTLLMKPGNFAIFFPSDVHRPNCTLAGPEAIRKIVIKVKMSLITEGQ